MNKRLLRNMKLLGCFVTLLLSLNANAQTTPPYYNMASGVSTNAFPWSTSTGKGIQWLVDANEFASPSPAPQGNNITVIWFYAASAINATYNNFSVKLGQVSSLTDPNWTAANMYNGNMKTVIVPSTRTITASAGSWFSIPLDTVFLYDPSQALVVEVSQCGFTGTSSQSASTASLTGIRRKYLTPASCVQAYAGQDALMSPIGVTLVSAGPCTAPPTPGTVSISNTTPCLGTNITLGLNGNSNGLGQTFQWESATSASGPFTPITASTNTAYTTITASTVGTTYLRAAVTCSGQTSYSDTVSYTVPNPFPGGTYTINSALPTGGSNFHSFGDAISAISCGITSSITFNVAAGSGPYVEQIDIPSTVGATATKTVLFNGNGNTLTSPGNTNNYATLNLNGADYFTFKNLIINTTGASNGFAVHLMNGADNNTFDSCTFNASMTATGTTSGCVSMSASTTSYSTSGANGSDNKFTNCTTNGGYFGFSFYGASTTGNTNNTIRNCTIKDYYVYGVYCIQQASDTISGNSFERNTRAAVSTGYGVMLSTGCNNTWVEKNKVRNLFGAAPGSSNSGYGIYVSAAASSGNENKIYNNLVADLTNDGTTAGIYLTGATYVKAYHNTVSLDYTAATTGTTYGIYATGTTSVDIKNNNISITRGGSGTKYCLYFTGAGKTSDFNNLYINSPAGTNYVGYYSTSSTGGTTLAAWKAVNSSAWDQNSVSADPLFANPSAGYYLPSNSLIDNAGTPVGITTDIAGTARSATTPDVGAYEFSVAPCSGNPVAGTATAVNNVTTACPGGSINLSLSGFSIGTGISIQWESSPAGAGTWTAISGATSSTTTVVFSAPTDYRASVTCANGGGSDVSNIVSISSNPTYLCYCSPLTGNTLHTTTANYITAVSIPNTTLNSTTSAVGAGGYTQLNYTTASNTATLTQGQTYTLNATIANAGYQTEMWIDWDQSGTFDSTEYMLLSAATSASVTFQVPATAVPGLTGLRLRNQASTTTLHGPNGACSSISIGRETEDYVITIAPGVQCSGIPSTTGSINAANTSICNGGTVTMNLSGFPSELGISYQWESSPAGQNNFTAITGATGYSYTSQALSADMDYRVAVICNNPGGGTAYTNTLGIVVNNPQITSTTGGTRCGVGTVNLSATTTSGNTVNWYANATGGSPLATNTTSFTTPVISNTTTFYAGAITASGSADSVNVPLATGSTTGVYYHMFMVNATNSITISSIGIKCNNTVGTLTSWDIYYRPDNYQQVPGANTSSNGWTLLSSVTNVPSAGVNAYTTIATGLNLNIPSGTTYSFHIAPVGSATHQYGTSAAGTTVASNTNAAIIAGHRGSALFNCNTSSGIAVVNLGYTTGCTGTRVPVVATVTAPPAYTVTASPDTICLGGSSTVSVNSANNYTYTWTPIGSGSSFSASPATTTKYYVTGTDANNCNIYDSVTVHVKSAPASVAAIATPDAICSSGSTTVTLNPTPMSGIGIQWEKNTGSGFTPITGANSATYTDPVSTNTVYRAQLYCNSTPVIMSSADTVTYSNPSVAQTFPGARCGAGPVTLAATGANGTTIRWYANSTGGSSLATGNVFTTPAISSTTTYYAAAASGNGSGSVPELIYYKFDGTGTSVINEASSPVSAAGTVQGTASIGGSGQFGTALLGSGATTSSNSVNANWPLNLSGPWTISAWFSGVTNTLTSNYMFGGSGGSSFRALTGSGVVAGAGNLEIRATGMNDVFLNNVFDAVGTPVVLHYVYDPTIPAIKGYVNGVLSTTVTQPANLVLTGTDFTVGGQAASNGLNAGGKIDEFRLYNRALSAAEIAATWNVTLGGCEGTRVPVTATINSTSSGTGVATGGTTTGASQSSNTVMAYTDACNDTVAVINSGSTALGNTSATVLTSSTVQTHQNKPFVPRAYDITPTTNGPATVTLYALQSEFSAYNSYVTSNNLALPLLPTGPTDVAGMSNIVITQFHGAASAGNQGPLGLYSSANVDFIQNSAITVSPMGSYWKLTFPVTGFSGFFIHSGSNPLALDLKSIAATNFGSRNRVDWISATEAKGDHFELERSIDGNFVKLATIEAKGTPSSYSYWDENPVSGVNYYRIKMVDASGRYSYSKTVSATVKTGAFQVIAYPNPVKDVVTIKLYGQQGKDATILLTDVTGKVLRTLSVGQDKLEINLNQFAAGFYFIKYSDSEHSQIIKIHKQ